MVRRVAYVVKIFPKLSETFIANELAELQRRGLELRILSLLPPREELRHEFIEEAGLLRITHYDPSEFANVVEDFAPELLHAHFATEAAAVARDLAAQRDIPFTFTAHGYDIFRKPPSDFGERARAAAAVITVSQANATYIANTFDVPPARLRVIPCGVDTSKFNSCAAPANAESPLILCVARLVVVKNLSLLLQSCGKLRERGLRFRCVVIGDGPCRDQLMKLRAELGLEHHVQMPGAASQSDVLKWWNQATVGVLTSDNEGMPVSLMEAASCGVPVVATAVGGIPELVEDGVTGLLVQARDVQALAGALERLLSDEGLRRQMSAAARVRAKDRFSISRQVDQLLAVWSKVLNGGRV